ncbi:MAG: single-stranded DNA-binding protein [Verrucomicrobia bacterium]|nr:single-stranded DNA-binding protein [Verrucomicrobiota bacterium]MBP5760664.1 single-stranded DNA-binding protein [Verrucomicrobiota bacterium]
MANFNKVLLMGNLTRDPELRYTPSGTPVATFGLAVNRTWKDANGQPVNDTLFVDITAFSGLADTISRFCRKGSPLFVEGRLKLDTWEDKQTGQRRSRLHVVMEAMQLLSSRQDDQGGGYAPRSNPAGAYGNPAPYPNVPPAQPPYGTQSAAYAPPPSSGMPPVPPPAAVDPSMEDDVPF